MIKIIAAVNSDGIIGKNNEIPWHYPEDFEWFKNKTLNSTVIMGRKTFDSIKKPLSQRENIIITSSKRNNSEFMGTTCFNSIPEFFKNEQYRLRDKPQDYWFIGGSSIYQEGMLWADEIYLTLVPDYITGDNLIKFPWINPTKFEFVNKIKLSPYESNKYDSNLYCLFYKKIK